MKKVLLLLLSIMFFSFYGFSQVSIGDAEKFMKKRCTDIEMEYVDGKPMKWDESTTIYVFLTKKDQNYCVSMISQYALKVMKSDCGGIEKKTEYYNLFK